MKTGVFSVNCACSVEPFRAASEVWPADDDLRDRVEVARADERLVLDGPVAVVPLQLELALLQPRIGQHALVAVGVGQLEHAHVHGMEAGQGDELELVAHRRQVALEGGDLLVVEQSASS